VSGRGAEQPGTTDRAPAYGHDALIVCDNLLRIYQSDLVEVQALQGLDLLVHEGGMVAIVGASGSGKSTLLRGLWAAAVLAVTVLVLTQVEWSGCAD
jgi:ABC-type phosphate/phosphonate transport system ATPase subunit